MAISHLRSGGRGDDYLGNIILVLSSLPAGVYKIWEMLHVQLRRRRTAPSYHS